MRYKFKIVLHMFSFLLWFFTNIHYTLCYILFKNCLDEYVHCYQVNCCLQYFYTRERICIKARDMVYSIISILFFTYVFKSVYLHKTESHLAEKTNIKIKVEEKLLCISKLVHCLFEPTEKLQLKD